MASDEDYAAFLEKANQPTSSATTQQTKKSKGFTTKSVDTQEPVPTVLQEVQSVYVSEADEEFVPVSLGWSGKGGKIDIGMLRYPRERRNQHELLAKQIKANSLCYLYYSCLCQTHLAGHLRNHVAEHERV